MLLDLGGRTVAPPKDLFLFGLIGQGCVMNYPVVAAADSYSICHLNVAHLFLRKDIQGIATGFALALDGVWYRHSWGLNEHRIIETNGKFTDYWGSILSQNDSGKFIAHLRSKYPDQFDG